jgi:hypothetical protein
VLLIGFVFTNNMTLMLRPEKWATLYAASEHGLHLNLDDPSLWPRLAHFVLASFALSGLAIALIGAARGRSQPELGAWMKALGLRLFVVATLVGMAVVRQRVKDLSLAPFFSVTALEVRPQWGVLLASSRCCWRESPWSPGCSRVS